MRLTSRGEYALRALAYLVRHYAPEGYIQAAEIALQCDVPRKYLEQILSMLAQFGILESKRGQEGGYRLRRPPEEISLGETLRAVEGQLTRLPPWLEGEGTVGAAPPAPRQLQDVLLRVRGAVREILDGTTLTILAADGSEVGPEVVEELMYYI